MRRIAKPSSISPESHQWHNKTASECTLDKRDPSPPRAPLFEQARLNHIFAAQGREPLGRNRFPTIQNAR